MRLLLDLLGKTHQRFVFQRRSQVLARNISALLEEGSSVLDVGCGNGQIAALMIQEKPSLRVTGVDIHARPSCAIPFALYDGTTIPYPDRYFDAVILVDVLHHTHRPAELLQECVRVAKSNVIIKDHYAEGYFDHKVLAFMDWVGNRAWNVKLTYHYLSRREWIDLFKRLQLKTEKLYEKGIGLYPLLFKPFFENGLHFIVKLKPLSTETVNQSQSRHSQEST